MSPETGAFERSKDPSNLVRGVTANRYLQETCPDPVSTLEDPGHFPSGRQAKNIFTYIVTTTAGCVKEAPSKPQ